MTITRKLAPVATAVGIAAMTVATFTTAALADGPRGRDHRYAAGHSRFYAPQPHYNHGHRRHNNIGAGVAIGLGALFLGAVLASEANRRHVDRDYD